MELSPLVQLLIVAVLAYGAGLLLGLSFYRGEIGPGRRPPLPARSPAPTTSGQIFSDDPKRRRRRKMRRFQDQLGERVRQALALIFILAIITMLCIGIYSILRAGADVLTTRPH